MEKRKGRGSVNDVVGIGGHRAGLACKARLGLGRALSTLGRVSTVSRGKTGLEFGTCSYSHRNAIDRCTI